MTVCLMRVCVGIKILAIYKILEKLFGYLLCGPKPTL